MKQLNSLDFDKLPFRYLVMTHLPYEQVMEVLDRLYKATILDCFYVTLNPPFTLCLVEGNGVPKIPTRLRIDFSAAGAHANLSALLALLSEYTDDLTYKAGGMGFTVDGHGYILDAWELADGMC